MGILRNSKPRNVPIKGIKKPAL